MDLLVTEIIVDLPFEFFSNKQHYHPDGLNLGTCVFVYVHIHPVHTCVLYTHVYFVYRVVPGDRNWHIETADWNLAGFFTIFRSLLAGIWGSFLRFIETGFRNWLAAFL